MDNHILDAFQDIKNARRGQKQMQNQSMKSEHKDFHLAPIIFYKSHHPVDIQMQETKQCATPTTLHSHDMNTTDKRELSCGYFTGLNKTMLSKVTKFIKMHELFKKKKLPQ
jgi:hypothetical protein